MVFPLKGWGVHGPSCSGVCGCFVCVWFNLVLGIGTQCMTQGAGCGCSGHLRWPFPPSSLFSRAGHWAAPLSLSLVAGGSLWISSLIAGRLGLPPFSALGCVTCLVCFHHRARGRGAWCLASCWLWPLALGVLGGSAPGSGSAVFQLCRILSREEQGANIRAALLGGGHGAWRAAGSSLLAPAGELLGL